MTPHVARRSVAFALLSAVLALALLCAAGPPPARAAATDAPLVKVSGQTIEWTSVAGVASYVLVRKVPGQADQYSVVNALVASPAAVPGKTVRYAVRTNVTGSTWSSEVSIAYPASGSTPPTTPPPTTPSPPKPPPTTPPPTTPPPATPLPAGGFSMGVTAGTAFSYELPFISSLGARTARLIYDVNTSAASMATVIDAYASAGVRPLLCASFPNRLPSTAEAQNVATWARAYGPGGTFWQGKSYPANTAVSRIEFGHETSYSYQFSDNSQSTYANRAKTYALRFKDAQVAVQAANPSVGLLAIGDNAVNQDSWVVNMFRAVPDLGSRAAGWTIHPYGPNWRTRIDSTINSTRTAGSPDLPIWVTEWGLSTDNGRCLSDNYGYDKCMTYAAAASTLHSALTGMLSAYGRRLGAFYLYQAHDQTLSGAQTGREYYFGALQQRGGAKGAFTTEVKADLAAHP